MIRRVLVVIAVIIGLGGGLISYGFNAAMAFGPHIALIDLDDAIHPSSARFVKRAILQAIDDEASVLIIRLNTPGGLLDSTREIVEATLNSPIPIVVFVAPESAHAASAGTFITAAAHIAAMAPVTSIGAATPVSIGGEIPDKLERKISQDAAAFLREIAKERGRNAESLEATVFEGISYTSSEALEENIIDFVADDVPNLIHLIDGMTVELRSGSVILDLEGLEVLEIERTALEIFLSFLADPNLALVLVSFGLIAILIEWVIPGLWGPGILGVISLSLGLVALGELPVNWIGVVLMLFAVFLFYLEIQAAGIGIFGVSGVIAFLVGGFLLVGGITPPAIPQPNDAPSFRVNPYLLVSITGGIGAAIIFLVKDLAKARILASKDLGSTAPLVGQVASTITALVPRGTIRVGGEDWTAVSDSGESIDEGESVIVSEIEGLTLKVFKSSEVDGGIQDSMVEK